MKVCLCYCFTILTTILELPELLRSFSCKMGGGYFAYYRDSFMKPAFPCLWYPTSAFPCSFPQQFRVPNMLISVLHIQADNTLQLSERQTLPSQVSQPGMTRSSTRKGNNRPDFVPPKNIFFDFKAIVKPLDILLLLATTSFAKVYLSLLRNC